jgi:hypothetical protein
MWRWFPVASPLILFQPNVAPRRRDRAEAIRWWSAPHYKVWPPGRRQGRQKLLSRSNAPRPIMLRRYPVPRGEVEKKRIKFARLTLSSQVGLKLAGRAY